MGSYMIHFTVYTLAMCGLIFFALFVYKKVMIGDFRSKGKKLLDIEETMHINPRKSLLIVRADNERFLIASDVDSTSLIAKLDKSAKVNLSEINIDTTSNTPEPNEIIDEPNKTEFDTLYPPIKLEVIKNHASQELSTTKSRVKSSSSKKVTKGKFDTMREMAKKINEL